MAITKAFIQIQTRTFHQREAEIEAAKHKVTVLETALELERLCDEHFHRLALGLKKRSDETSSAYWAQDNSRHLWFTTRHGTLVHNLASTKIRQEVMELFRKRYSPWEIDLTCKDDEIRLCFK
jgi:hypothetical protein